MKNSTNIVVGILGAAAAGVVIGMILAPKKGKDLRSDIMNSAQEAAQRLGDLIAKGKEKYDELTTMLEDQADETITTGKELVAAGRKKLES